MAVGLLSKNDRGDIYDRFRHRILFPIRDIRGHVIGFGGRALGDSLPKYLNSPDGPLFDKGASLYGIDLARPSILESGTTILVEGYMDVVIPHQCGVTNVVACMGTALTESHLGLLRRITKKLILALDADAAGVRAAQKGAEAARQSLEHRVVPVPTASGLVRYEAQLDAEIHILMLPDGLDPDELILKDRALWDDLVAEALTIGDFYFRLAQESIDVSGGKGKREAVDTLLPIIAAMDSVAERTHYLQRLARWIHIDERHLLADLERLHRDDRNESRRADSRAAYRSRPRPRVPTVVPTSRAASERADTIKPSLEAHCLALLAYAPELMAQVTAAAGLSAEAFEDVRNRQVFEALQRAGEEPQQDIASFRDRLDSELSAHVESLLRRLSSDPPLSPDMTRDDLVKSAVRLQKGHLARLIRELQFLQQDAQEHGQEQSLRDLNHLIEELRQDYLLIDQRYYAATLVRRPRKQLPSSHGY